VGKSQQFWQTFGYLFIKYRSTGTYAFAAFNVLSLIDSERKINSTL